LNCSGLFPATAEVFFFAFFSAKRLLCIAMQNGWHMDDLWQFMLYFIVDLNNPGTVRVKYNPITLWLLLVCYCVGGERERVRAARETRL
jgi:hypothetical protein